MNTNITLSNQGFVTMRQIESAIIRFSGDSGDGMQLVGAQFSATSAAMGNDLSTFPDYPSEIRAPAGTVPGVSGFQVNIGSIPIYTPGDEPDILVAMNPAALKANLKDVKRGGTIIVNVDAFDEKGLQKAGYTKSPLRSSELKSYQVIEAHISTQTLEILKDSTLDQKTKTRTKNFYALGIIYYMYGRELNTTIEWLNKTFQRKPEVIDANIKVLKAGYNFAETLEASISTYTIAKAKVEPGYYRQVNGNVAIAWGLIKAAEAANLDLFLGSYPITPATDILHELSKFKNFNVRTFQAEDEIAGICTAIGASYAGALAVTTTSGPGLSLKAEAIGLAIMMELPLVIVDIQRGGPSTGLPTKTEQSDLNIALNGRHGEAPLIVVAASSPSNCFHMAYEAARLSLQHMTPVILLSDGFIANGAEPWRIPDLDLYSRIETRLVRPEQVGEDFSTYQRDPQTLARLWAVPGTKGAEHRVGGLEKDFVTGNVSHDPMNHEKMTEVRADKVARVADFIPQQEVVGAAQGDLLVLSWGGTYGATFTAVKRLQAEGHKVSLVHLHYINPLPRNLETILCGFKRVVVPELNKGQMANYLRMKFPNVEVHQYNKMQGLPFKISELTECFQTHLRELRSAQSSNNH